MKAAAPLPTSIQVGPIRYSVDCSELAGLRIKNEARNAYTVGLHEQKDQRISLDPGQGPDATAETLVHEVLHAVWAVAGLQETPAGKHDEMVVTVLAPLVLDTLRRNPELVSYLTGG